MEDLGQTLTILSSVRDIYFYEKPLYIYRKHADSATNMRRHLEMDVMESTIKQVEDTVSKMHSEQYDLFKKTMILRLMRQSTFADYDSYMHHYNIAFVHEILSRTKQKTFEMWIYLQFRRLYFIILFPFTRIIWKYKTGMWKKIK